MPCELFKDYTRMCVERFDNVLMFWPLSICENEENYKNCPLYIAIKDKKPVCNRLEECTKSVSEFGSDVSEIIKGFSTNEKIWKKYWTDMKNYCLNENYINCQRHQTLEKERVVSNDINPDGSIFNYAEFFVVKKEVASKRV